jgi:hypothetical protein
MERKTRGPIGQKHTDILRALYHLNSEQRTALLRKADPKLVRYICECALNVLRGNVPLHRGHKNRLRKHVNILRRLANPQKKLSSKKKIIVQHGGFLPALLAPLIGSVLASLISK